MPGRVIQDAASAELLLQPFGVVLCAGHEPWRPRYNLGPGQSVLVIRDGQAARMRWGVPAKQRGIGGVHPFARCETIRNKSPFRQAVETRRCIVPITGWYEWPQPKQVHCVRPANAEPLALAAIYELGRGATFAIVTCEPNAFVAPLHHRMGVFLRPTDCAAWLDPGTHAAVVDSMMKPAPNEWFREFRVSTRATRTSNDDARCVAPISETALKRAARPRRYGGKLGNLR